MKKYHANYLRDFIYGSIDGTITTFAIVSGVYGAGLSQKTIIILGFANVLADGFSMASSNYLGTKSENDERDKIHAFELEGIKNQPKDEEEEVRQIFKLKGFKNQLLEDIVSVICSNQNEWLKIMLQEEYGITLFGRSPIISGMTTFFAFVFFGFLPLIPFMTNAENAFFHSSILSGISFFLIGAVKSKWSLESPLNSGLKTLLIGAIASFIAYYSGHFLEGVVD